MIKFIKFVLVFAAGMIADRMLVNDDLEAAYAERAKNRQQEEG